MIQDLNIKKIAEELIELFRKEIENKITSEDKINLYALSKLNVLALIPNELNCALGIALNISNYSEETKEVFRKPSKEELENMIIKLKNIAN